MYFNWNTHSKNVADSPNINDNHKFVVNLFIPEFVGVCIEHFPWNLSIQLLRPLHTSRLMNTICREDVGLRVCQMKKETTYWDNHCSTVSLENITRRLRQFRFCPRRTSGILTAPDRCCYCLNQASLTIRTKGRAGKFPVGGNQ